MLDFPNLNGNVLLFTNSPKKLHRHFAYLKEHYSELGLSRLTLAVVDEENSTIRFNEYFRGSLYDGTDPVDVDCSAVFDIEDVDWDYIRKIPVMDARPSINTLEHEFAYADNLIVALKPRKVEIGYCELIPSILDYVDALKNKTKQFTTMTKREKATAIIDKLDHIHKEGIQPSIDKSKVWDEIVLILSAVKEREIHPADKDYYDDHVEGNAVYPLIDFIRCSDTIQEMAEYDDWNSAEELRKSLIDPLEFLLQYFTDDLISQFAELIEQ